MQAQGPGGLSYQSDGLTEGRDSPNEKKINGLMINEGLLDGGRVMENLRNCLDY